MKRRKQFLSIILVVVMLCTSLQFPEMVLYAEQLSEEETDVNEQTEKQTESWISKGIRMLYPQSSGDDVSEDEDGKQLGTPWTPGKPTVPNCITASKQIKRYEYGTKLTQDDIKDLSVIYHDKDMNSIIVYPAIGDESGYTTNILEINTEQMGDQDLIIKYVTDQGDTLQAILKLTIVGKKTYITADMDNKEFKRGEVIDEVIDKKGLVVTYYNEKGEKSELDPSRYTTNASSINTNTVRVGKHDLTVTYREPNTGNELKATVEIMIVEDPYIRVTKTKRTYTCGDTLNIDDLQVRYYNGRTTNYDNIPSSRYETNASEIDMSTPGVKKLIVTYNRLTAEVELTVRAKQPEIRDPYIEAVKTKTEYETGETLDISDLTVTYYDGRGASETVTDFTTNAGSIDMTTPGKKELVISYNRLTTTIELTVIEKIDPEKIVSTPTASLSSGTIPRGSRVILSTITEGAEIYYTTDDTTPGTDSRHYTEPIIVDRDMTIKAIAVKTGFQDSDIAEFQYTISENREGLKVEFAVPDRTYIYTGSPITPGIIVTNNGVLLKEGIDYSVKYSNNINVTDSAKITVTGKNNLTGSRSMEFAIIAKQLDNSDVDAYNTLRVEGDHIVVVEGSKTTPAILYGGALLTAKDYDFDNGAYRNYKWTVADNGVELTITGKGNFTGTRKFMVNVLSKEQQSQNQIIVSFNNDTKNLVYNGYPRDIRSFIYVSTKGTPSGLEENRDYMISAPEDIISAGTKKYTVVGISDRCVGSVTKSYTITPKKANFNVEIDHGGYPYVSTGSTIDDMVVRDGNRLLTEGKDYTVSYSNNKKVGTAKFTLTGIGSYKGSIYKGTFKIIPAALNNDTVDIVVGDKVFSKPGVYKSVPYVSTNGVAVKASDYTVTYYLDDPRTNESARVMNKKDNKITSGDTRVWVKIAGKGKGNFTADSDGYAVASYMVRSKAADSFDLSKAKVTFQDKNTGKTIKKVSYTGYPITDLKVVVTYKTKGGTVTLDENKYTAVFTNNVNKGTATVVITGKEGQNQYVGSKKATFRIVAGSMKSN